MYTKLVVAMVSAGFLAAAVPVVAHHAFSTEFDADKPIKLEGTVTKMEWVNPHAWLHIDVKKPDGTSEVWRLRAARPTRCSEEASTETRSRSARWSWSMAIGRRTAHLRATVAI